MSEETFEAPIRFKPYVDFCVKHDLSPRDYDALTGKLEELLRAAMTLPELQRMSDEEIIARFKKGEQR